MNTKTLLLIAVAITPGVAFAQASGAVDSYDENGTFSTVPSATGADAIAQGKAAVASGSGSTVGGGVANTTGAAAGYATEGGEGSHLNI